jgi:hypothetical protein
MGALSLRSLIIAACLLLCGCGKAVDALIAPPKPQDISQYATETGVVVVTDSRGITRQMYSSEYLLASINYTNQKCDDFFDQLARFNQDSSFVDKVLAASITAATPLMATYGVGANAVALTAASVAYAQNLNKFASEIYAFAPYATQLRRHVKEQMTEYLKGISADWRRGRLQDNACIQTGGCYNELERLVVVRGRAQQYANICSLANIRSIIDSSLANTQSVCSPGASAGGAASAAEVPTCKSQGTTAGKPGT